MKDALIYLSIGFLAILLYIHKIEINDLKDRMGWLESVTFESARCPKE